jgi:shikimate dehydrogenase
MVTGTSRVFATFGNPNLGNPAPAVYNAAFKAAGIDAVYVALEPADIGAAMNGVRHLGLGGGTITAPFKQEILRHLDEVDGKADEIGAVNVVVNRGGRLVGYNSDWIGAMNALREVVDPADRPVALLGAGGVARAIAFGLQKARARTVIFNRTWDRARDLCAQFDCAYGGDLDAVEPGFDVIINATSVGMGDQLGPSPINDEPLTSTPVVFDVVVRPRETLLMQRARRFNCPVIGGIAMVAHQAVPALEWLTGTTPDLAMLRERFG